MSNDLTQKKLEQLILEVLQERDGKIYANIKNATSDAKKKAVYNKVYGQNTKPDAQPGLNILKALAAKAGSPDDLEVDDYRAMKSKYQGFNPSYWKSEADRLEKSYGVGSGADDGADDGAADDGASDGASDGGTAGAKLQQKYGLQGKKSNKTAWFNSIIKSLEDGGGKKKEAKALLKLFAIVHYDGKIPTSERSAYVRAQKEIDEFDTSSLSDGADDGEEVDGGTTELGTSGNYINPKKGKKGHKLPELASFIDGASNNGIAISDRKFSDLFGQPGVDDYDSDASFQDDDVSIKPDSSVIQIFRTLSGDTFTERLQDLFSVTERLIQGNFDGMNQKETFAFSAKAALLMQLFDLARVMGSQSGGYAFEKVLAALIEGAVIGGENGASDAMTALKKGNFYTSAKLLSSGGVKQALNNKGGLAAILNKSPQKSLWYGYGYKSEEAPKNFDSGPANFTGTASKHATMWFYVIQVYKKKGGGIYSRCVLPSGGYGTEYEVDTSKKPVLFGISDDGGREDQRADWFAVLPLLTAKEAESGAYALADKVSKSVMDSDNELLKAIMVANKRLENMKRNTSEFRSNKAGTREGTFNSSKKLIQAVSTDYGEIKSDFNTIFGKGSIKEARRRTGKMSKVKTVDNLISEVMQEIKNKYNK